MRVASRVQLLFLDRVAAEDGGLPDSGDAHGFIGERMALLDLFAVEHVVVDETRIEGLLAQILLPLNQNSPSGKHVLTLVNSSRSQRYLRL